MSMKPTKIVKFMAPRSEEQALEQGQYGHMVKKK